MCIVEIRDKDIISINKTTTKGANQTTDQDEDLIVSFISFSDFTRPSIEVIEAYRVCEVSK